MCARRARIPTMPEGNFVANTGHSAPWRIRGGVRGEPVLFVRCAKARTSSAGLMLRPQRLLKVINSTGDEMALKNFSIRKSRVVAAASAGVPFLAQSQIFPREPSERTIERHRDGIRYLHFSEGSYFHGLQVAVDYETDEQWDGPMPEKQAWRLPEFCKRLRDGKAVSVALLGDSISEGANASGWTGVAPFQPAYGELLKRQLEARTKARVKFRNLSKSGMTSSWGVKQRKRVTRHSPDLVMLAFGMNDASEGVPAARLASNIRRLIDEIRRDGNPNTEFIVVSGMSPNSAWHLGNPQLRQDSHDCLSRLAAPGVAFCDVRSVWDEMVRRKGALSLTGNGVNHPNDFGHRVYCDCLLTVLGEVD